MDIEPLTKNEEQIQKFKEIGDSRYLYIKELIIKNVFNMMYMINQLIVK